jgi:hypothetical protein
MVMSGYYAVYKGVVGWPQSVLGWPSGLARKQHGHSTVATRSLAVINTTGDVPYLRLISGRDPHLKDNFIFPKHIFQILLCYFISF